MAPSSPKSEGRSRTGRAAASAPVSLTDRIELTLQSRGLRETIESVVIAVVLALLFRTFVAEPFVIPTGSMATELQGRHQHVDCPICEFPYRLGASREKPENFIIGDVFLGSCPQCGFIACTRPEVEKIARRFREGHRGHVQIPELSTVPLLVFS